MREAYCRATLVTAGGVVPDAGFIVEDGVFSEVAAGLMEGEDLRGAYVLPGFIDSHIHGIGPFDFGDPNCDFEGAAALLRGRGTTTFLPTICPRPGREYRLPAGAATPGFHLEGPFLNPARKGGFDERELLAFDPARAQAIFAGCHGAARIMTAAPEIAPAAQLGPIAAAWGVRLSAGHTQADAPTARAAFAGGYRGVTHFFNAMAGHRHREPGLWDEALLDDGVTLEVIADLRHVSAQSVALLLRAKGAARLIAISDSVCAAGDGCEVRDGLVYRGDIICGSQSDMLRLFDNLVGVLGVSLPDAVRMTSHNAAAALGLDRGDIRQGCRADFLVMDRSLSLRAVHAAS